MLAALVDRFRTSRPRLVVSRYGAALAPPTLYDRSLFPEILALDAGEGGRPVVERHRAEALCLEWPAEALCDVDEPADYARVRALVEGDRRPAHAGGEHVP
jgi:CTP:molybdopterin cytidylyltransferase MocA